MLMREVQNDWTLIVVLNYDINKIVDNLVCSDIRKTLPNF